MVGIKKKVKNMNTSVCTKILIEGLERNTFSDRYIVFGREQIRDFP